jgi:endo-1,4-beta-xylanase
MNIIMKRSLVIFIFVMLLIAMSTVNISASDNLTNTYKGTPVIDGIEDDIWKTAASIDVKYFEEATAPDNPKTATAAVKTLWDEKFMYFYIVITDPVIDISNTGNWYERDCVGIALDYNNVKDQPQSLYDNNNAAGLVDFGIDDSITGNKFFAGNVDGVSRKVVQNDKGWVCEAAIPHCKTVSEGMKVGFEVQYNDARDGGRKGITNWSAGGADLWQYTDVLGTTVLSVAVTVPSETVTEEPVITLDESETTETAPATGDNIAFASIVILSALSIILMKKRTSR